MHISTTVDSPYLTAEEAAVYMRYSSAGAFRRSVKHFGIPHTRRGRKMFFTKAALDEFMSISTEATKSARRRTRKH